jgi:ATP-dependent DNA ligase
MQKTTYQPCIPTRATKVPAGQDWLHEIKHDGYRLIVIRDGDRVKLLTRNATTGQVDILGSWSPRFETDQNNSL